MDDDFLKGLRDSSVVAKNLGQTVDYSIYRSETPQGGDFNPLLVVEFENSATLKPNKEQYEAFMKEWGKQDRSAPGRSSRIVLRCAP